MHAFTWPIHVVVVRSAACKTARAPAAKSLPAKSHHIRPRRTPRLVWSCTSTAKSVAASVADLTRTTRLLHQLSAWCRLRAAAEFVCVARPPPARLSHPPTIPHHFPPPAPPSPIASPATSTAPSPPQLPKMIFICSITTSRERRAKRCLPLASTGRSSARTNLSKASSEPHSRRMHESR